MENQITSTEMRNFLNSIQNNSINDFEYFLERTNQLINVSNSSKDYILLMLKLHDGNLENKVEDMIYYTTK